LFAARTGMYLGLLYQNQREVKSAHGSFLDPLGGVFMLAGSGAEPR
jgi:hypothetical protein